MKRRKRILISILAAVICAGCFYMQARSIRGEYEKQRADMIAKFGSDVVDVVVAKVPLEVGDVVDRKNCEVVSWVAPLVPKDAIVHMDDIEGSVVQNPQAQGAPLTQLTFRKNDQQVDIPSGYVALSLHGIDKLGIQTNIPPGSQIAAYEVKDNKASLLTSNIRVISCSEKQKSCLVAVLPNEVPKILEVMDRGALRIVMPAGDIEHLPRSNESRAPQSVEAEVRHE